MIKKKESLNFSAYIFLSNFRMEGIRIILKLYNCLLIKSLIRLKFLETFVLNELVL